MIAVVPPQRDLDRDPVALAADGDRPVGQRRLGAVEIAHESDEAAFVKQLLALRLGATQIRQHDAHARIEEGEFAQTVLDRRIVEIDHRESLRRGGEGHLGAALLPPVDDRRRAGDAEPVDRVAVGEMHQVFLPVAPDAKGQAGRQRIDDGNADAVQAAGDLVGVLVEFAAGVELGHDDLGRRNALFLVDAGGNAASVVDDGAGTVCVQRHRHQPGVPGERLVDRVVDDLIDHVVEARAVVGVADIHARALTDRVKPPQHLDRIGAVCVAVGLVLRVVIEFERRLRIIRQSKRPFLRWV